MKFIPKEYRFKNGDCYVNVFEDPAMLNVMYVTELSPESKEYIIIAKSANFSYYPFQKKKNKAYFSTTKILEALYL